MECQQRVAQDAPQFTPAPEDVKGGFQMTTHLAGNAQADPYRSEETDALKPTVSWPDEDLG
jgi:hypothetical protein